MGGTTIEEEGGCQISCPWVGLMVERETKTKGCDVQGYGKGLKKRRWGGEPKHSCVHNTDHSLV
jgi:hypothetical protein